jgi:hypothetical protein
MVEVMEEWWRSGGGVVEEWWRCSGGSVTCVVVYSSVYIMTETNTGDIILFTEFAFSGKT